MKKQVLICEYIIADASLSVLFQSYTAFILVATWNHGLVSSVANPWYPAILSKQCSDSGIYQYLILSLFFSENQCFYSVYL